MTQAKNTICLWYDKDAEEAARFYEETFPDSSVDAVHKLLTRERIGRKVSLDVLRDGVMIKVDLAVTERPDGAESRRRG